MRQVVIVLVVVALAGAAPVPAQFLRWTDDQGVVHYVEGLDNVPERHRPRAAPLGLRNAPLGGPAGDRRAVAGRPRDTGSARAAVVHYRPGERILVDVTLNGGTAARLLLDTGADRTLIDPRSLVAAGASLERPLAHGEVRGVTGRQAVSWILLESLSIGDLTVERIAVAAHAIGTRDADGLLGRDVLDRFHLAIDAARGVVTLTPR